MPKEKKEEREKTLTRAATWNLMGRLTKKEEKSTFFMTKRKEEFNSWASRKRDQKKNY